VKTPKFARMSARRLAAYVERLLMAGELGPNIAPRVAVPLRVANAAGVATDAIMPKMNGRVLAERLAAQRPRLRVLFMSGYTDDDMLRRGIMDPRMAFLQKPFTPDALAKKVREVLDASASAVPSLPPVGGTGKRVLK
jgi:DNA-binding NarL/FixJ family response regulator